MRDIKPLYDNIMVTCPFHKNGEERKPSCGISINNKIVGGKKVEAGTVHCFTCGTTMSIEKFISYLLGFDDSGSEGTRWLLNNYEISHTRQLERMDISRNKKQEDITYIPEQLLDNYRYTHPYMYTRGLTDEIIEKYDIGFDSLSNCITFPVRDINGNCLFVAKRSVNSKFFVLPASKDKPLYGIYEMDTKKKSIYICESFLDALTLVKWGYNAISLMGTGSHTQYELINNLNYRTIYIVLDGDEAGKKGTERLCKYITKNKLVKYYELPIGKDINDLTIEQFQDLNWFNRL